MEPITLGIYPELDITETYYLSKVVAQRLSDNKRIVLYTSDMYRDIHEAVKDSTDWIIRTFSMTRVAECDLGEEKVMYYVDKHKLPYKFSSLYGMAVFIDMPCIHELKQVLSEDQITALGLSKYSGIASGCLECSNKTNPHTLTNL